MNCDTPLIDSCNCNYIKETVNRIDKIQKRVISDTTTLTCVSCETSLFTSANNTIPVRFTTCCGNPITAVTATDGTTTEYFRIESVRCNRYVTVRLLDPTATTATLYTMIIDLDCIGTIQCFEPITVEVCTSSISGE